MKYVACGCVFLLHVLVEKFLFSAARPGRRQKANSYGYACGGFESANREGNLNRLLMLNISCRGVFRSKPASL